MEIKGISIENEDDFEIDEENITEEQFLNEVDETYEQFYEQPAGVQTHVRDELSDHLDLINNPSEEQAKILSNIANKRAEQITKKMETISVAPGEGGTFQNWGKDVFLEEQCFPEKFPYGTGGYLSSCVDNPENDIGFVIYKIRFQGPMA